MVKNLPAVQETWVLFLGQEDPLEKGMAIHSGILVWRIPRTEEPSGPQSAGSRRVRHNWAANTFITSLYISFICLCAHSYIQLFWGLCWKPKNSIEKFPVWWGGRWVKIYYRIVREVLIQIYAHSWAESVNHFDIWAVGYSMHSQLGWYWLEKGKSYFLGGKKFLAMALVCDLPRPAILNKSLFFYI